MQNVFVTIPSLKKARLKPLHMISATSQNYDKLGLQIFQLHDSGGSRGGAWGAQAPLILDKKEEMTEGRKASRGSKSKPPPPPPPPLSSRSGSATAHVGCNISFSS